MDDRRQPSEITDSALGWEVQALLSVDPSADFVSRVRSRISSESAGSREWQLRWVWIAAAAVTIAALALRMSPPWGAPSQNFVASDPPLAVAPVPGPENLPPPQAPDVPSPALSSGAVRRAPVPDVQVSEAELAGFRLFVAGVRNGRLNASLFGEATATSVDVEPFQEIAIPPIAIEPLEPIDLLQGDES